MRVITKATHPCLEATQQTVVKVVQNYPRKVEWRIQNTMVDIHSKLSQLGKWKT